MCTVRVTPHDSNVFVFMRKFTLDTFHQFAFYNGLYKKVRHIW